MKLKALFLTVLATMAAPILAAKPRPLATYTLPSACPGIKTDGEITDGSGCLVLMVTFHGKRPSNAATDKALRAYLTEALKRFSSQDILVTGWLRKTPKSSSYDDDQIYPYPKSANLVYTAKTKKIGFIN